MVQNKKKRRIWPWVTLIVIGVLLGALRLAMRSDAVLDYIRSEVEVRVSDRLNGALEIERLDGDLWSHVTAQNIRLYQEGGQGDGRRDGSAAEEAGSSEGAGEPGQETGNTGRRLVSLDSLYISYSITDLIFQRPFEIKKLHLLGMRADISQDEEGVWNILTLLEDVDGFEMEAEAEETEPEEEQGPDRFEPEAEETAQPDDPFLFVLDSVRITAPEISVHAEAMLPHDPFEMREMELNARLGRAEAGFFADIHQFEMDIHESRLETPVSLASEASWDGRRITLDKLVVAGAYSLAGMSGSYNTATMATDLEAFLDPLAWREAEAYLEDYPLRQDVNVSLHVGGSRQNLQTGLTVEAPGLEKLAVDSRWSMMQEPVLNSLTITSGAVDAGTLIDDDTLNARIGAIDFSLDGSIPLNEWDRQNATGILVLQDLQFEDHTLDEFEMDITAQNGRFASEMTLRKGVEEIALALQADQWWTSESEWSVEYDITGLNPGYWSGLEEMDGVLTSRGSINGQGWEPGSVPWQVEIGVEQLRLTGYPEVSLDMSSEITADSIHTIVSSRLADGQMQGEAGILWNLETPQFRADLQFDNLDFSEFPDAGWPVTNMGGSITAQGEGLEPESMMLDASLVLDDSEINRQHFETIQLDLALQEGMVRVEKAAFAGAPGKGSLSLTQNIFDLRDSRNRLNFDIELLDLQGFANLAGADTLRATGNLTGTIQPDNGGNLRFESALKLENLQYDTLTVARMEGSAMASIAEEITYQADLEIFKPGIGTFDVQDIALLTEGVVGEDEVQGEYDFNFNIGNESGLRQHATYRVADSIHVRTRELDLVDPAGIFRLQEPFEIIAAEGTLLVEHIQLISDRGAELAMSLEKRPDSPWSGFLDVRDTDLGQIQYVFLEEPIFEAMFTGRIDFLMDEVLLEVGVGADVSGFEYDGLGLDSIQIDLDLADRRLVTNAHVWHAGDEILRSEFDLPCEPRNPERLGEEFMQEEVSGYLRVNPTDIARFDELLNGIGLEQTRGEFSLFTTLSGMAGNPDMEGELQLGGGELSGVSLDTLMMSWDYDHQQNQLQLGSSVHSLGQQAAELSGIIPLYIDFEQFMVEIPESGDAIDLSLYTNDFDLAVFNDFLDPEQMSDLRGTMNADVEVKGSMAEPEPAGNISLSGGNIHLMENNITMQNIEADVEFIDGTIELNRLYAESIGSFRGKGHITLDGYMPDELNLRFSAVNFRAANTRDFELFAGVDLRLEGSIEEPRLAGDVRWERGTLYMDDFGEEEVEEVTLEDEDDSETPLPDGPDFFERLEMVVKFNVDRNAFVRSRRDPEVNLALQGELDVVKEPYEELQLFGNMGISSGHVTTFNKRFKLEQGDITFSGDPANPQLAVRTLYQPPQQYEEIRIYYIIGGTLSEPEFEYESEPEMELQDIISYTLFGRPFHALAGWEQTVSGRSDGNMATNIAVDILVDRIESLASDRLGIDVIEIENTRKGGSSGTSIKAGKFISDRIFIAFLQEIGSSDAGRQVMVEYMINRNLELIITASDDYRSGVDMMWQYDY